MNNRKIKKSHIGNFAQVLTGKIGSPTSLVIHTLIFIGFFVAVLLGWNFNTMLLVLTMLVSLEAIYLSLLIQMTVNQNTQSLEKVESDIDEIEEDFGEMRSDVEEITEDIGEMEEHIGAIQDEVEEIGEDVEEISGDEIAEEKRDEDTKTTLENIHLTLQKLMQDVDKLKAGK